MVSNGYRTVGFMPTDQCGMDPCGNNIYCLPYNQGIYVLARAATLAEPDSVSTDEPNPQARLVDGRYDGVTDASGNSLNGQEPELNIAKGSLTDNYSWAFRTTDAINTTPASILSLSPGLFDENIGLERSVEITFNDAVSSSSLNTDTVQLWPEPRYELWFRVAKAPGSDHTAVIQHPTMVSRDDGGWMYQPVITQGVKSAYGICLYPAMGPGTGADADDCGVDSDSPNCCADLNARVQGAQGALCLPPNE